MLREIFAVVWRHLIFQTSSINYAGAETVRAENQTTTETVHNTTHEIQSNTPYPTETTLQQSPNFNTAENEQYRTKLNTVAANDNEKFNLDTANTSPYPSEDGVRDNIYNSHSIGSIGPILLTQPSEDPYLQPEINEITNGFVGKIVSMIPSIIASNTKLLKPIIVTDNSSANKREISADNSTSAEHDGKSDQVVDSAQPEEYHEIPDEQVLTGNETETFVEDVSKDPPKYTEAKFKNSNDEGPVDVDIEPQMLEEQAVITTTVDIAKSLPLALNFIPETDNHLSDIGQPLNLPLNFIPQQRVILPQPNIYLQPHAAPEHPVMELLPQAVIKPDHIHQPFMLPNSEFHYIPIPVLHHQPNIIPLNYINDTRTILQQVHSNHGDAIRSSIPEQPLDNSQKTEYSFVKSIEDYNPYKPVDAPRKPFKPQHLQIEVRRPGPYTINVPAAHLLPYVKQNFIQPYSFPQKQMLPTAAPKSHSAGYNLKQFPKEKRAPQKAPFKPSHPVWDSVYPPSHMYYVPLYVVDKVPGERNPKDSFSRRHHHLRRLYVEYGGFKPPLVPSTLIETDETVQEKRDVPKEGGES